MLVSDLIDQTLAEWLYPGGDEQPHFDTLTDALTADLADLSITLEGRADTVPRDTILEIGSELILVESVSGSSVTAAKRAYMRSTLAAHSVGDLVWVDPTFTRRECLSALRSIIGKLYAWGVYRRVVDSTLDFDNQAVLTTPAGTKKIISILARRSTTDELYRSYGMRGVDWIEYRQFDPPKFLIRGRGVAEGQDIHLVLMKDFELPDAEADNLTTFGLTETLQEDLPMAVAGQVLKGREVPRVTLDRIREALASQGLNPGVTFNIGESLVNAFRRDAVMAERNRLNDIDEPVFEWQRR